MVRLAEVYREAHPRPARKPVNAQGQSAQPASLPTQEAKSSTSTDPGTSSRQVRCHRCKLIGHIARECPNKVNARGAKEASCVHECDIDECIKGEEVVLECGHRIPVMSVHVTKRAVMPVCEGVIESKKVTVLRDTGCSGVVIKKGLVPEHAWTGKVQHCVLVDGTVRKVPMAAVKVSTPYFTGVVQAMAMESPLYDLVIGNIKGARGPSNPCKDWKYPEPAEHKISAVETRGQKQRREKPFKPLSTPVCPASEATPAEIINEQLADASLQKVRELADKGSIKETPRSEVRFEWIEKLLYRSYKDKTTGRSLRQLVVPSKFRNAVMSVGHEILMSGHLGTRKTTDRIMLSFYWPGILADVRRYCQSCDICQRTKPRGCTAKVPLGQMPLIDVPFQRIAVDIVGPIHPTTERGNRYILTIVDYATRYPEAVPLPGIEAERVAEALVDVFCRVGVPNEILTDQGTQFTSGVMKEVARLLSMKQLVTTPYHPQCNGLVERFNGTLKSMLKKMCAEKPRTWDRYLPAVLFAYREAPQESLGFSPFELLYGRSVRGPVAILKELWTKGTENVEVRTTYQYVLELRNRLEETCKLAKEELEKNAQRYKKHFDKKARARQFKEGDKVLLLLPTDHNKLLMQWKGPYKVNARVGVNDYKLQLGDKEKVIHANLLRRYVDRDNVTKNPDVESAEQIAVTGVVNLEDEDLSVPSTNEIKLPPLQAKETPNDVKVNPDVDENMANQAKLLLNSFPDVLTDLPGCTNLIEHEIELEDKRPIHQKMYPVPFATRETIKSELDSMMKLGVIEKSQSPYTSPIVIVKKKDGSNRFCVDYRRLNNVTVFDAEPMPNIEDLYAEAMVSTSTSLN